MADDERSIEQRLAEKRAAAAASARIANAATAGDFAAIHAEIDAFEEVAKLKGTDKETYDKLIAAVEAATARNTAIAEIENRVKALGGSAMALWCEVKPLVAKFL